MTMRLSKFHLPPVQDALVVGKKAPIGSEAILAALEEMTPGRYERIPVEHPTIDALIVLSADLRKIPRDDLTKILVRSAGPILDPGETLHIGLEIEIQVEQELRIGGER